MTNSNNELLKGIIIEKVREIKSELFDNLVERYENITNVTENIGFTDLKLRHASYYLHQLTASGLMNDEQAQNVFEHLCNVEYEAFTEWESDNLSYVERNYIGHTSSFYYNTNSELYYSGAIIQDLLIGNNIPLEDVTGDLTSELHDLLFENDVVNVLNQLFEDFFSELEDDSDLTMEDYLEDLWSSDIEILEELDNEINEMQTIVDEAIKAYNYLDEFKTEENEKYLIEDYLYIELSEIIAPEKADEIYDVLISKLKPLNKLTYLNVSYSLVDNIYVLNIDSNLKTLDIHTGISDEFEISEKLIINIVEDLKNMINNNFEF